LLYWPNAWSTALLHPAHYDLDRFDSASVEQAIRKADQTPDVARIAYMAAN
jgi:hypothetical protein